MTYYPLIKHLHILLALLSGIGFALRGYVIVVMNRPLRHPAIRVTPHIVDTFLLLTGLTLWILAGWSVLSWLGVKLLLIVAYILCGILALRNGHSGKGIFLYWLSLGIFIAIALVAVHK